MSDRARALGFWLTAAALGCGGSNDITRAPRPPTAASVTVDAVAPAPLESGRLSDAARPTHYALSLIVDPEKDRFAGDVTIDIELREPTRFIVLHGRELSLVRAEALVGGEYVPVEIEERAAAGGKGEPEELVVRLARTVPPGHVQLRIAYSAPLVDVLTGLYRVRDGEDSFAFTQFQPADARRVFPCFDEPAFKVPFDVKVTTPKQNLVFGNTPEVERIPSEDGQDVTFVFATTPPLPTYLVAVAVGPLEAREAEGAPIPLRLITTRGKGHLGEPVLSAARDHARMLANYFDRPFPFPKLDLLAVPEFGYGAMENAGLVTFREELVLFDSTDASPQARRQMGVTVAHELSHHWFGNSVTIEWWDDLWLNEGFATWLAAKIVDEWKPGSGARLEGLAAKSRAMDLDALDSARAVRQPVHSTSEAEAAFDAIVYDKGSSVLGMLEQWLGPEVFRDGVRSFIAAHEGTTATSADLFQALSVAAGREVWPVASTFLDQSGVPLVRAELSCAAAGSGAGATLRLEQSRHRARPSTAEERRDTSWMIPVCVAFDGDGGQPACGLLEGPSLSLELPGERCPRWVYPNAGESGYYRFALSEQGFRSLVRSRGALGVAHRVGLVSNMWALVQSGDLEPELTMKLLFELRRERDRLVVEQIIAVLRAMNIELVSDAERPRFRRYATALLLPMAKELGWSKRERDSGDDRLLRRSVLEALSVLSDDRWMKTKANERAQAYLDDPASMDVEIAGIALSVASRHGKPEMFTRLTQALRDASTPQHRLAALSALASLGDPALLRRALDLILSGEVRKQDAFYLIRGASAWPESQPVVIDWLEARFPEIRQRLPGFIITRFLDGLDNVCEPALRNRLADLLGPGMKDVEGASSRLSQVLEKADSCVASRARAARSVGRALAGYR